MLFYAMNFVTRVFKKFDKRTYAIVVPYYLILGFGILVFFIFPQMPYRNQILYISLLGMANHYVPLPVTATVYYMGQMEGSILLIAALGALASSSANAMEFFLLSHFRETRPLNYIKNHRIYFHLERFFHNSPFILIVSANIFPLPIDPVRWLAVISRYSFYKFYFANFAGRIIRYSILIALAKKFPIPADILIYIGLGLLSISAIKFTMTLFTQKDLNPENNNIS